jgi:hypothetical protein
MDYKESANKRSVLTSTRPGGEPSQVIAAIVLSSSPRDFPQMRRNFTGSIQDINPDHRKKLEETITVHLHGTYQAFRLMNQQGNCTRMREPVAVTKKH